MNQYSLSIYYVASTMSSSKDREVGHASSCPMEHASQQVSHSGKPAQSTVMDPQKNRRSPRLGDFQNLVLPKEDCMSKDMKAFSSKNNT